MSDLFSCRKGAIAIGRAKTEEDAHAIVRHLHRSLQVVRMPRALEVTVL